MAAFVTVEGSGAAESLRAGSAGINQMSFRVYGRLAEIRRSIVNRDGGIWLPPSYIEVLSRRHQSECSEDLIQQTNDRLQGAARIQSIRKVT